MSRSVRLYTPAQFEEVRKMVDLLAERSELAARRTRPAHRVPGGPAADGTRGPPPRRRYRPPSRCVGVTSHAG